MVLSRALPVVLVLAAGCGSGKPNGPTGKAYVGSYALFLNDGAKEKIRQASDPAAEKRQLEQQRLEIRADGTYAMSECVVDGKPYWDEGKYIADGNKLELYYTSSGGKPLQGIDTTTRPMILTWNPKDETLTYGEDSVRGESYKKKPNG